MPRRLKSRRSLVGLALAIASVGWTDPTAQGGGGGSSPRRAAATVAPRIAKADLVELNHFINPVGRRLYQQVIFYDWSPVRNEYVIRQWRLVRSPSHLPQPTAGGSQYVTRWTQDHQRFEVHAKRFRETWTQDDPERRNRDRLAEEHRLPLFR